MSWLPWKRDTKKAAAIPVVVVTNDLAGAIDLAPVMEREGLKPRFLLLRDLMAQAGDLYPKPQGLLVLRELATEEKVEVCEFAHGHPSLQHLPIGVVCSLLEGAAAIPADVVIRSPGTLVEAVRGLRELVTARQQA